MTSLIPDTSNLGRPGRADGLFTVAPAPSALGRCGSGNSGSLPAPRRHHQLQLHPAGAIPAALRPLPDLLGHRPLLPGRLPDAERVARRGHHADAAPGRGQPPGADEADLLFPAGKRLQPEGPRLGIQVSIRWLSGLLTMTPFLPLRRSPLQCSPALSHRSVLPPERFLVPPAPALAVYVLAASSTGVWEGDARP